MLTTREKLLEFIRKRAFEEKCDEGEVIREHGLQNVLFMEMADGNVDYKTRRAVKKIKDAVIIRELMQIVRDFPDVILLKGLWYSEKYYGQQELRLFGDIDLYVREIQFADFDRAMKRNGYACLCENSPVPSKFYFYYDVYDGTELSYGLLNHYVYEKEGFMLPQVEVHTYLLPFYQYPLLGYQEIYERRKEAILCQRLKVNVLECNDDFIYAACHLCKHLVHSIVAMEETEGEKWRVHEEKNIYDMACMIDAGEIDWQVVVERAKRWDVLQDVLVACNMVRYFFPDSISQKELNKMAGLVGEDWQRGLYKSLVRDLALSDASNVFKGSLLDFVNAHQVNPVCRAVEIPHRNGILPAKEILRSRWGNLYSEWDSGYWYLIYELGTGENVIPYVSIQCSLYDIHAVTFLLDKEKGIVSRNVKYERRKPADWLKNICVEENLEGQCVIKISFEGLRLKPQESRTIVCQLGLIVLDEEERVADRVSLFGRGYYHFYDMGVIGLTD